MKLNKSLFVQLLFLTLNLSLIHAGSIRGGVKNEMGYPLSGVNISVQDSVIFTTSNQFGLYSINNLPSGKYIIVFNYVGYKSIETSISLEKDENKILNILLVEEILNMEAVLVTAQKKVEQVQNVPVTMTVIEEELLQQSSQVNLDVLSGYVPGLLVNTYSNNRPNYVIRGLTSDAFLATAQPRVSVFYNNVPISRNTGALIELYDMERIEILKGPQGTLFGRGAQIGAIHLVSKKPKNLFQGEFAVGFGNHGQQIYNGMINVPITNNFYSRFTASHVQRDGFLSNTFGGGLNERKTTAFRTSFRYIQSENTIMDLIFDYQEDHPGGTAFMSRIYPNQLGQIDVFGETTSFERGADLGLDRKIINLNFNIHHYFNNNLDLNSFLSYREHQVDEVWEGDGSAAPALDFEEDVEVRQISFESRLNFKLGHRFSGFAGISYWRESVDQAVRFGPNEQSLIFLFIDPRGLVDDQGKPNFIPAIPPIPEFGELGGLPLPIDHVEESFQQARNQALESFVDGTFSLSKNLSLTTGLRFIIDRIGLDAKNKHLSGNPSTLGLLTGNYPNVLFATGEVTDMNERYQSLVGRIIAGYSFNENLKTYMGYARGRRPNVIQLRADAQAEILDDEKVNSYEIGFKGILSDQFYLDLAAYFYDYTDFQTRAWVADQASGEYQLIVKDGGKAHAFGFESSLRYAINQFIQLYASYAYIHARFDQTDSNGNEQEYAGNRFRLTPDHAWSFRINLNQTILNSVNIFIKPSFTYRSHHFFEDDNTKGLEQEGYGLFNLQTGFYYYPIHLELSFFAYNIFDTDYLVSAGNTGNLFSIPTFVPGAPQIYGIRLKWDF